MPVTPAPGHGFIPFLVSQAASITGVEDVTVQNQAEAIVLAGVVLLAIYVCLAMALTAIAALTKKASGSP